MKMKMSRLRTYVVTEGKRGGTRGQRIFRIKFYAYHPIFILICLSPTKILNSLESELFPVSSVSIILSNMQARNVVEGKKHGQYGADALYTQRGEICERDR